MNLSKNATVIIIAAIVGQLAVSHAVFADPPSAKTPTGAWLIDATPAQDIVPPFKMLMTFHADGTLVETQNDLLAPPFFGTTGHGVWEKAKGGPHTYSFTMMQLLFDPNFTGALIGTLKTRASITVDGHNRLHGVVEVVITDTGGNILFAGGGNLDGARIQSEPLD